MKEAATGAALLCQLSHLAGTQFEKFNFTGRQVATREPRGPSFWYYRENQLHRLVRRCRRYPKLLVRDASNEVIRRHMDHLNSGKQTLRCASAYRPKTIMRKLKIVHRRGAGPHGWSRGLLPHNRGRPYFGGCSSLFNQPSP